MDGIDDKKRKKLLRDLKRQSKINNPTFTSPDSGRRLPLTPNNMRKYNVDAQGLRKFKTGTFNMKGKKFKTPKTMPKTSTIGKLGKYALGAYIANQILNPRQGGILPPADRRKEIVAGKGGDINFTLAGTRKSK